MERLMHLLARGAAVWALAASVARANEIDCEWAYHSAGPDARLSVTVPGRTETFLANGSDTVPTDEAVTLHVLTPVNFAGDMDEQVFVRWWDGAMAHWIMGAWVTRVTLGADGGDRAFPGQPESGDMPLDLWRIQIPAWITRPGDNFYAIQLKGYRDGESEDRYLLARAGGDFSRTNQLGQIWSASEEFNGQDWRMRIEP